MKVSDAERSVCEGVRTLLTWAHGALARELPPAVARKTAMVMADNLAAIVAARNEPEVIKVHDVAVAEGGRAQATIFCGRGYRTDRINAALANGIAGSWCELDEGYRLAPCHAGLYTLPAVLAEAEVLDLSVEQTMRVLALSYEVTARVARCWVFPTMTLHPHPQTAAIGGAIASALARGLTVEQVIEAVTAAATLITVGDYRHAVDGALVRNVWAATGTANGMRAADWARCGIGGSPRSPYAVYTELLGQPPAPSVLTAELGETWAITAGYHKMHACCQSTHSAAEAMLHARARLPRGKTASSVTRIELATHRPGMTNPDPATTLAAKFSFEHVVSTALAYGHAGQEAFAATTLADPLVSRLRHAVAVEKFEPVLPRPHDRPARIRLHLDDGTVVSSECLLATGGPDQPWPEDVIVGKIGSITNVVYPGMLPAFESLMAGDKALQRKSWRDLVQQFGEN